MLRLEGVQTQFLFDQVLPEEVRELPEDLARLDELLADPALLAPIEGHWRTEARQKGQSTRSHGRPTIPMSTYVRLMVIKQRTGWGYETLVKEVSDSLHLRRFCLIGITERVPEESTVRKLTRRLGSETVEDLTRQVIAKAVRERRFRARAARIDSTVVEADVRYPSDAMLCLQGARALARQGRRLAERIGERGNSVRNRSRAVGRRVRQISRTLARGTGEARQQLIALNAETGLLLRRSATEARRLATAARAKARGRGAQAKLRAAEAIEQLAERCERVAEQTAQRLRGEKITDRIVSLADPDARPIRKGKAGKPNEFGYVAQVCEVTPNTRPGARGFVLPASSGRQPGREHAPARDRRRAPSPRAGAAGGRSRRRLRPPSLRGAARRARTGPGLRLRPPGTGPGTDQAAIAPLPNRGRGPDIPPQAWLRLTTIEVEGAGGPAHLDSLGDPGL
jgi:IS5 family transposase